MIGFLDVQLPKSRAAAFAQLHPPTAFADPSEIMFRATGRTPSGLEIEPNAERALCDFGTH
jgi:hypothetical protein